MAKLNSILVILSIAINLDVYQFDIKNAFFNSDLDEEIYMRVPLGLKGRLV